MKRYRHCIFTSCSIVDASAYIHHSLFLPSLCNSSHPRGSVLTTNVQTYVVHTFYIYHHVKNCLLACLCMAIIDYIFGSSIRFEFGLIAVTATTTIWTRAFTRFVRKHYYYEVVVYQTDGIKQQRQQHQSNNRAGTQNSNRKSTDRELTNSKQTRVDTIKLFLWFDSSISIAYTWTHINGFCSIPNNSRTSLCEWKGKLQTYTLSLSFTVLYFFCFYFRFDSIQWERVCVLMCIIGICENNSLFIFILFFSFVLNRERRRAIFLRNCKKKLSFVIDDESSISHSHIYAI